MISEEESKVLELASMAGHILLENGAEISRVEETMERIASRFGVEKENFFVISNGIFTTAKSYANVEFIPINGGRLEKVVAINQLSRDIEAGKVNLEEAFLELEHINKMPPKPLPELTIASALGSGGFCAIFGGSIMDCSVSLFAGMATYLFLILVCLPHISKSLSNICSGALGTILCILASKLGMGDNLGNMIIGTIIPLIPGVAFTNGLRDIANEDYLAGITRLMDAVMVFLSIAIGVCLSFITEAKLTGEMIFLDGTTINSFTANFAFQLLSAFVGTASFAVLFGVPRKHYAATGLVGMLGWAAFLLTVRQMPLGIVGGTLMASTLVAFLSRAFAIKKKAPSTVFLICGIFPLIPGAGVFWSTYFAVSSQLRNALGYGFKAVTVTIAIVLGIIIATNIIRNKPFKKKQENNK